MALPIHTIKRVSYQQAGGIRQDFTPTEEDRGVANRHLAEIAQRVVALAAPSSGGGAASAAATPAPPFAAIAVALRAPYNYVINRNAANDLQMQIQTPDGSLVGTFTDSDLRDPSAASASTSASSASAGRIQAIWNLLYNSTSRGSVEPAAAPLPSLGAFASPEVQATHVPSTPQGAGRGSNASASASGLSSSSTLGGGAASSMALLAPHREELILADFIRQSRAIKAFKESRHPDRYEAILDFLEGGFNQTKVGGASCFQGPLRLPYGPESDDFLLDLYLLEDMKRCMEQDPKGFKKAAVSFSLLSPELKDKLGQSLRILTHQALPFLIPGENNVNIDAIAADLIRTQSLTPGLLDLAKDTHISEKLVSLREAAYQAQIRDQRARLAGLEAALKRAEAAIGPLHEAVARSEARFADSEAAFRGVQGRLEASAGQLGAANEGLRADLEAARAESAAAAAKAVRAEAALGALPAVHAEALAALTRQNEAAQREAATELAAAEARFDAEKGTLQAELAASREAVAVATARVRTLEEELGASSTENAALTRELAAARAESAAAEARAREAQAALGELEAAHAQEITGLQEANLAARGAAATELAAAEARFDAERKLLTAELAASRAAIAAAAAKEVELNARIAGLSELNTQLNVDFAESQLAFQSARQDAARLTQEIAALTASHADALRALETKSASEKAALSSEFEGTIQEQRAGFEASLRVQQERSADELLALTNKHTEERESLTGQLADAVEGASAAALRHEEQRAALTAAHKEQLDTLSASLAASEAAVASATDEKRAAQAEVASIVSAINEIMPPGEAGVVPDLVSLKSRVQALLGSYQTGAAENAALKKAGEANRADIAALTSRLEAAAADLATKEEELSAATAAQAATQASLDAALATISHQAEEISGLRATAESTNSLLSTLQSAHQEALENIAKLTPIAESVPGLTQALSQAHADLSKSQESLSALQARFDKLSEEKAVSEASLTAITKAFLSSQAKSLALEKRLGSLSAEKVADKAALGELRESLAGSELARAGLATQISEQLATIGEKDTSIASLRAEFESTNRKLDAANRGLLASLVGKEQELQALKTSSADEEARLKGEISEAKRALEQFSAKADLTFGALASKSEAQLSALSSRLEKATGRLDAFKATNEAKQRDQALEIDRLQGQLAANLSTYQSSLEALNAKLGESTALTDAQKAEIDSLTAAALANATIMSDQLRSISQLERRLATTEGSLARVSSELKTAQAAIEASEAEKAAALQTNEALRSELAALNTSLAEQKAASDGAIESLTQALGAKEAQRALEASGKAEALDSLQEALKSVRLLGEQVADLQAAAIASAASKAELEAQVKELTQSGAAKITQIEFLKHQKSARQEQIAQLRQEKAGVQALLDRAQLENSLLQAAVASQAEALARADGSLSGKAEEITVLKEKLGESSSALEALRALMAAKDSSHDKELGSRDSALSELRASHVRDLAKEGEAFAATLQSLSDRNTELEASLKEAQAELEGTSGSAGLRSQFAGATSALAALTGQIEALKERFGGADLEDIKKIPDQILALKAANSALQAQLQALSEANLLNAALKERFEKAHQETAQKLVALGITSQAQARKLEEQAGLIEGLEGANAALRAQTAEEVSHLKAELATRTEERDAAKSKLQEATELFRSALAAQGSAAESKFADLLASLEASDKKLSQLEGAQQVLGRKFSEQTALLNQTQSELAATGAILTGKTALLEKREAQLENIADHLALLRQRKVKSQVFNALRSAALTQKLEKAEKRIRGLETSNRLLSNEKSDLNLVLQGHLRELESLTDIKGVSLSEQRKKLYEKLDGQEQLNAELQKQLAGQLGTIRGLEEKRDSQAARILELDAALSLNKAALASTEAAATAAAVEHRAELALQASAHEEASAFAAAAAAATATSLTERAEALEAHQGTLESEKAALKAANQDLSVKLEAEEGKAAKLGAQVSALEVANGGLKATLKEVKAASAAAVSALEDELRATQEANRLEAQAIGLQLQAKEDANEALGKEIAALKAKQEGDIAALERTHAEELSRLGSSKDEEKAGLIAAHEETISALQRQHEGILNPLELERAAALAELAEIRPALAKALADNQAQSAKIDAQEARLDKQDEELRGLAAAREEAVAGLEASALELAGARAQASVEADALREQAEAARGELARLKGTIKAQVGGAIAALRAFETDIPELAALLSSVDVDDPSTLEKLDLAGLSQMFAHKITALAKEAASSIAFAKKADAATIKAMAHSATLAAELEDLKPTIDALAQARAKIAAGLAREFSLVAELDAKTKECAEFNKGFENAAAQLLESLGRESAMGGQIRALSERNAALEETLAGGAASAAEREAVLHDLEAAFRASTDRLRSLAKSLMPASDFGKFARRAENIRPALCRMLETRHPSKEVVMGFGGKIEDIQRRLAFDAAFLALPFATDKGSDAFTQKNLTGVGPVGSGGGSGGLRVPDDEKFNPATRDLFLRLSAKKLPTLGAFKAEIAAELQKELGKRPPGGGAAASSFEAHLLSKTKALVASVPKEEGAAGAEIKGTFPPALNALFNALLTRENILVCIQARFGTSPLVAGASPEVLARVLQAVDSKIESGASPYDGSSQEKDINDMADFIIISNISRLIDAVRLNPSLAKELCALRIQLGVEVVEQMTPAKKELIEAVQQGFEILRPVVLALLEESFSA